MAAGPATVSVPAAAPVKAAVADGEYAQRFLAQYDKIKDPANGYFSPQGIPYHSVETLIVEAPDYGHETTSEAYSYWVWLEALYGQVTEDWAPFNHAWDTLEKYMIPTSADQPTNSFYNPISPATYARGVQPPEQLPVAAEQRRDRPAATRSRAELKSTYGNVDIYGMHWLADVDNKYGFGATPGAGCELGPTATGTSYINTFQRGPQESVWETVPQPSCEEFKYGGTNGFLDLFTKDAVVRRSSGSTPTPPTPTRARSRPSTGPTSGRPRRASSRRSPARWPRPPRWATTCATRCSTSTSRRSAAPRRPAPPAPARTARTTCCPGTTPGAARSTRRPAGPGASARRTRTSATRTRSRPGCCRPTRP